MEIPTGAVLVVLGLTLLTLLGLNVILYIVGWWPGC